MGWGSARAIGTQEARSHPSVLILRPAFMVLECAWPFFEKPQWLEPVCDYFRSMGYGLTIRREQASDYLAQVRPRGILTATRHDFWHLATGPLRTLFSGTPPPRRATVGSARVLGPHPPLDSPLYLTDAQARYYSPAQYLKYSWPWTEYTRVLKDDSVLPTILKSYGRADEIFPASEKGWHGFFVEAPRGPRFLHPRELAVAQNVQLRSALPSCHTQAWQLIGNSIPPPMAYLGLLRPAAALQGWGMTGGGGNWAADGFLMRCCHASDGAWGAMPRSAGPAPCPGRSKSPPATDGDKGENFLDLNSPKRKTPQVDMVRSRRARESETPTTIWMDPPSREETQNLRVALQALRGGALDVSGLPGAAHRDALRVRGLDQPPRQSCLTPAPSTPDSVAEPSPQVRARPRSPVRREAWCPTRTFATLAFTALAAQAWVTDAVGPHGAVGPWSACAAVEPRRCGHSPGCPQAGHPGSIGWPCWRLASGLAWMDYDATLDYPGGGPQLPRSTPSAKSEALTPITANATSWSTGSDAGVLSSEAEVPILQEVRLREDSLRAARSEAKKTKYHGTWAAANRIGPCGPASGGLATLVCETKAFRAIAPDSPGPHWKEGRWTHTAIGAGGTHLHVINLYGWPQGTPDLWKNRNALWKEVFGHAAGLGDVPWVMAGDWNVTPDELWVPALAPRTSGWLPDVRGRRPTCFPVRGEPTEKYFFPC